MKPNTPRVSVIIPTYNRAGMIVECLESVLNQTYSDYEVIVVDDGSTDDTEELIGPYLNRIRYIKQENMGNAGARNSGIEATKGDIVAFNDSDDLWLPDKLERQVKYLDEHPDVGMVCGNGIFFGSSKVEGKKVISDKRAITLEKDGVTLASIFMKSTLRTPTMVVRRKVIETVGGFDPDFKVCVDLDFAFRVLMKFKVAFMNEPLFKLRKHDGHVGGDNERRTLFNIKAIEKLLKEYPEASALIGEKNINRRLAYRYYRLGKITQKKGRKGEALEAYKKSLSYRPFYPSCIMKYLRCKFS
ncbi:MAG: glycosyltransferase [bacterium]|nr:glycosyltransferase [bacterium]